MSRFRVLVVGSANMDLVMNMDRIPLAGESLVQSGGYEYIPGGKGANAAVAVARLCGGAVFCARVGNDANGKRLLSAYAAENIDTRFVVSDKSTQTGLAGIFLESDGQNRIVVYPGANGNLTVADAEEAFLSYPDALFLNFEIDAEVIVKSTEIAREQEIPVFIDAGPTNPRLDLRLLRNVEIFSPNERETYDITGIELVDTDACLKASSKLYDLVHSKYVVLKLSSRGCFVFDGKYCDYIPSYEVTPVDTTAAGDAFTAALMVEYLRTRSIKKACRYANAVGALTVTRLGAMPSLPTAAEVERFVADGRITI